jgi:hypothetical protein
MQSVASVRALFTRVALPLAFFSALLLLPEATEDPALRMVIPWFVVLIMLQVAPAMLTARPDLFSPPISGGLTGAFSTLSTLLSFFVAGELRMGLLHSADPSETADVAIRTIMAMIAGTLGHYLGFYSRLGARWHVIFPRMGGLDWSRRRVLLVALIPAAVFVVAYTIFQSRVGVSLFDVTELARGKETWRSDPTLSWMIRGVEMGFVPALLYFTWAAAQRESRRLLVAAVVCVLVGLLVLRLGQRGPLAFGVLIAVIVFHYLRRRISIGVFLAVYFVGVVASNVMYHWRVDDPETPRIEAVSQVVDDPVQVLTTHEKERQRFITMAYIIEEFPATYPYLLGESWVGMVTAFVPRWIWPEKGESHEWSDNRIVFRISGVPAPTPYIGVLYANFSWIGIVLGTLLLGCFHRGLYEWRLRDPRDPGTNLLYALILIFFAPISMGISATLQYVVPVWLLTRLMRRRAPRSPR